MRQMTESHSQINQHLRLASAGTTNEARIIEAALQAIEAERGQVTNKDVILWLIAELETSHDVKHQELLRNALEIVVAGTPDDLES